MEKPTTNPTPTRHRRHRDDRGAADAVGARAGSPELPHVIRPRPLRLRDLEALVLARDPAIARLAARPEAVRALAGVVHGRDPEARRRFAQVADLDRWLRTLLLG